MSVDPQIRITNTCSELLVVSTCVVFKISTFGCVLHVTWIHCRSLDCGRFYIVVILRSRGSKRDQQQHSRHRKYFNDAVR